MPVLSRLVCCAALCLVALACAERHEELNAERAHTAIELASAENMRAHMAFLSSDELAGRKPGTPGYDRAAQYVAEEFAALDLKPAGTNGSFFQPIKFLALTQDLDANKITITSEDGSEQPLTFKTDFIIGTNPERALGSISAPAVFAGHGIVAPELGIDDYAGVDAEGKIVVLLGGSPDFFSSEEGAYYSTNNYKREIAAERGAVGIVSVYTEREESVRTFEQAVPFAERERLYWLDPKGDPFRVAPEIEIGARLSPAASDALFEGEQMSYQALRAAAAANEPVPGFDLGKSLTIEYGADIREIESSNVAAVLRGGDRSLRDEYVVITAHLDHLGTGRVVDGDDIYNGALDNAAGIATLLEMARLFRARDVTPDRSILFLAVTAEEAGMLGAEYFANTPTVPLDSLVANVNLDMPLLLYPFTDVIAFGAERSDLGAMVRDAAGDIGVELTGDPMPEQNIFVRSDHYRFVQKGIPAVFIVTGFGEASDGQDGGAIFREFLSTHYHKPSDEIDLPIDFDAGARFAALNYLIALEIAGATQRPAWREGDFFGEMFAD